MDADGWPPSRPPLFGLALAYLFYVAAAGVACARVVVSAALCIRF